MTAKSRVELFVGAFIIIGLIILTSFVFFIRDFQIIKPGYRFDIAFSFANGLKIGAPTRFSGVDIGEIKSIKIFSDSKSGTTKVRVRVWVDKDTQIPSDSQVWINTLGLLGEKYIEIMPGKDYSRVVKENDTISGQDPIPIEEITKEMKKLVSKTNETVTGLNELLSRIKTGEGTIGKFFSDETVYKNIEELTDDLKRHPWKLFFKTKEKPVKK